MIASIPVGTVDPSVLERAVLDLVPSVAGVAACTVDEALLDTLVAEERRLVAAASPVRRAEFAAGRVSAHRALAAIGADASVIGRGLRRQPVWPDGITGSISHAAHVAVAVVAPRTAGLVGIGVDIEPVGTVDAEVRTSVLDPDERAACDADPDPAGAATVVFCSKEAAFKALYPQLGHEIGFLDAHTELTDGAGIVEVAHLGVSTRVRSGRFGDLVAAVAVMATAP